jgi:pimeloyl-ACP methyl ester carboxylesterase
MVHGLPGSAYDWRELAPLLAARGLHRSRTTASATATRTGDPRAPLHGRPERAELLGLLEAPTSRRSSFGATAMLAAHRDPADRPHRAVGSAGPGVENTEPPLVVRVMFSTPVLAWVRAVPPAARGLRAATRNAAYSGQPQPDWWMPSLNANFGRPHTPVTFRMEGSSFEGAPPDTTGLVLPILVIHGEQDLLAPIAIAHALHEHAPHSKLLVIESGSHMLPVTHAPRLADEIAAFTGE